MPKKVEISYNSIFFIFGLIFFLWLLMRIWDIILLVFISFILMSALKPFVTGLEKYKFPRGIAILIVYILLWTVIGSIIAAIVPSLIEQTGKLVKLLPTAISNIDFINEHQREITQQTLSLVGALPENLLRITIGIFGNLINVLTTIVITFYLLLERKHLDHYLSLLLGGKSTGRVTRVIDRIENRLGSWVRGELVLMFAVGLFTYLGLVFLGMEIALPLALLAGLLEVVPNIGPILSAVPAVLIAFLVHPLLAVSTIALYFLVQFFENHLLVPKIMQKAAGMNPLVSIISLMIGFRLAGSIGAVLAIPLVIVIFELAAEFITPDWIENNI